MITWKILYKRNGKQIEQACFSKQEIVREYLNVLNIPNVEGVSELKIFKNDTDYTNTLNKFLSK
jgi:hypothetical protein